MTRWTLLVLTFLVVYTTPGTAVGGNQRFCAYIENGQRKGSQETAAEVQAHRPSDASLAHEPGGSGEILPDNKTIRCVKETDFCFTLWEGDPHDKNRVTLLKQGCWDYTEQPACNYASCFTERKWQNNTRFCCCKGDYCNENFTADYVPGLHSTSNPVPTPGTLHRILPDPNYKQRTIIIALVSVISVSIITMVTYLVYRVWMGSYKEHLEPVHLLEAPPTPTFELDQLKLSGLIERGRYGEVWRGTLCDHEVAVKVFAPHQKQYYLNEKDIYMLPHMDHASLPQFFGGEERITADSMLQYILVICYVPMGTLMFYLKENVIDWVTLCKMCHSVASGLAHLHTDITKKKKVPTATLR